MTTQYLEEADQLCDRLAVILDGRIVAEGSPVDLKREVGGEVLDVELEGGPDARERAATIAREFGAFADATVVETDSIVRDRVVRDSLSPWCNRLGVSAREPTDMATRC